MKVEFYRHSLGPDEVQAAADTLQTVFLTTGEHNLEFERLFARHLGVKHAITTSSCTAALHMALVALGVGEGNEVITTPMSFIASANAIVMAGATPVFVDVDPRTALLDLDRIEAAITPRTRAVLPVHLYGQMVEMRRLRELADRHGLLVIEDAAHAVEAERQGVRPGQLGDAACFSFYATKNITCGEGGALATNRSEVAGLVRQLRNHGMTESAVGRYTGRYQHWDMSHLGWKYNLTNFQAAMLIPQLQRIDQLWCRRENIVRRYVAACAHGAIAHPELAYDRNRSAFHLFTIWVDDTLRDEILWGLQEHGVGAAVNYRPIHLMRFYRERYGFTDGNFAQAERIGRCTISLPLYPNLRDEEVEFVINTLITLGAGKR